MGRRDEGYSSEFFERNPHKTFNWLLMRKKRRKVEDFGRSANEILPEKQT